MAESNVVATFNNVAKTVYGSRASVAAIPATFKIVWSQAKTEEDSVALLAALSDVIVKQANKLSRIELNPGLFRHYDVRKGNDDLAYDAKNNMLVLKQMLDVFNEKLENRAAPQTLVDGLNNAALGVINSLSTSRYRSSLSDANVEALTSAAGYMTDTAASLADKQSASPGKKAVLRVEASPLLK